jgi:hypothetical protein
MQQDSSRPSELSWDALDEETTIQIKKEYPLIFYQTPWALEQECLEKQETMGDGSCAFHALLGKKEGDTYKCDAMAERQNFVKLLREKLNPAKNGFSNSDLQKYYEANLTSALDEATKPGQTSILHNCALMLFTKKGQPLPIFNKFAQMDTHKKLLEIEKKILENKNAKVKFSNIFKTNEDNLKNVKEKLQKDPEKYHEQFCKHFSELTTLSESQKWLKNPLIEWDSINKGSTQNKDEILKSPEVLENFLNCLLDPNYWLSDDELEMLAHLHNLRVEIVRGYNGDLGCNNQHHLQDRTQDPRPPIFIHGNICHFSRCLPYGTA